MSEEQDKKLTELESQLDTEIYVMVVRGILNRFKSEPPHLCLRLAAIVTGQPGFQPILQQYRALMAISMLIDQPVMMPMEAYDKLAPIMEKLKERIAQNKGEATVTE